MERLTEVRVSRGTILSQDLYLVVQGEVKIEMRHNPASQIQCSKIGVSVKQVDAALGQRAIKIMTCAKGQWVNS